MLNPNIETFIGCTSGYKESKVVLFGAPFDSTTSFRPGARFAPKAIRSESFGIETYSPYQDRDLSDIAVFDSGDLELCIGDSSVSLKQIEERADIILTDGKIPFMIGGEHLVTLGAFRSVVKKYPDINILHFDAHTDLREEYLGLKHSHASVIRLCKELTSGKVWQFGIRSGDKAEFEYAKNNTFLTKYNFEGLDAAISALKGKPVYFTLDLDVLDPSIFSGTGTPEAGGVSFNELLAALLKLKGLNIVAADMCELAPVYDHSGVSTAVACKVLREILLAI